MVREQTKNGVYQKVDTVGFQADTEKGSNFNLFGDRSNNSSKPYDITFEQSLE